MSIGPLMQLIGNEEQLFPHREKGVLTLDSHLPAMPDGSLSMAFTGREDTCSSLYGPGCCRCAHDSIGASLPSWVEHWDLLHEVDKHRIAVVPTKDVRLSMRCELLGAALCSDGWLKSVPLSTARQ